MWIPPLSLDIWISSNSHRTFVDCCSSVKKFRNYHKVSYRLIFRIQSIFLLVLLRSILVICYLYAFVELIYDLFWIRYEVIKFWYERSVCPFEICWKSFLNWDYFCDRKILCSFHSCKFCNSVRFRLLYLFNFRGQKFLFRWEEVVILQILKHAKWPKYL